LHWWLEDSLLFRCSGLMVRFRSELGLDHRVVTMGTIRMVTMGTIPTAITGHIRTIIGLHTIGMAGIGTTATTIITTIDINLPVG